MDFKTQSKIHRNNGELKDWVLEYMVTRAHLPKDKQKKGIHKIHQCRIYLHYPYIYMCTIPF